MVPESSSVPAPSLVSEPVVAAAAPESVKVLAALATSMDEVVAAVRVKLRSLDAVAPVYCRVPPLSTRLPAPLVAAPRLPATPPSLMLATLSVPALSVVMPV